MNHNVQTKIAVINDFTGFGRCALAVSIPILSVMKIQTCAIPTAILSNHTAFESYHIDDYTKHLPAYIEEWKKLDLKFNGILSGYLGSEHQVEIVENFIKDFRDEKTIVIIDPVMGDDGKLYSSYNKNLCSKMKHLVKYADILTPNLTEACILTDTEYHGGKWSKKELALLAKKLHAMGPDKIVITGIEQGQFVANLCFEKDKEIKFVKSHVVGTSRCGTGDVFSAIIAADALNGVDFQTSVKKASRFVKQCILASIERQIPITDGVCFEDLLHKLK